MGYAHMAGTFNKHAELEQIMICRREREVP